MDSSCEKFTILVSVGDAVWLQLGLLHLPYRNTYLPIEYPAL